MNKTFYTILTITFLLSTNSYAQDNQWLCENVKTAACTKVCDLKKNNEFDPSNPQHMKLTIDCSSDYAKVVQNQKDNKNQH